MLTSRADNDPARLVSCTRAQLYEYWRRERRAFGDEPTVAKAAE
jgi:phosphate butyryltransferase